jgi:hypothetical protein
VPTLAVVLSPLEQRTLPVPLWVVVGWKTRTKLVAMRPAIASDDDRRSPVTTMSLAEAIVMSLE